MTYKYRETFTQDDVNDALEDLEQTFTENEPSNVPGFLNSWVDEGTAGYLPVGFWKTLNGIVHLEGRVKSGTLGLSAFMLPRFYRPEATMDFSVVSNDLFGKIQITTNGDVIPQSPSSNVWVSLNGISFRSKVEL